MTFFSHMDPSFGSVFAIEAVNEILLDPSLTPGYGQCMFSFSFQMTPIPNSIQ